MQTCGNTSLSLRFSSDFLVSTIVSAKLYLLCRIFVIHLLNLFYPAWCSNFCQLSDSLVNIYFYFSLLEAVLRECLNFLFFHRKCCFDTSFFLNYDYLQHVLKNGYWAAYKEYF